MKLYFAGTGGLNEEDIKVVNSLTKRRLLSYFYIGKEKVQEKIFNSIKDETAN